jgi:50S ribosomal protein L16 3-hydroxylase
LLVRAAMPGFTGPFRTRDLFALARRDDVESRLVVRDGTRWSLAHGPFTPR